MPKAPSSARPATTAGGILPSRSIASESTSSTRKPLEPRHESAELRPLGRRLRERVDEVEAEVAEEDLLQEGRRLPLGLAGLFGDAARLVGADGLSGRVCHERRKLYSRTASARAPSIVSAAGDEQVPVLRRRARPEGARDVLAPGLALRPRQRPDELRHAPALEAGDRRLALGGLRPRARVLDLCCGSGDLCFLAEDRGAGQRHRRRLHAADARRRAAPRRRRPGAAASCRRTRSRFPFADASFDAVTVSYGLRNIADLARALAEMRRVLAPGGRAVVLDFGKPDNAVAGALYRAFLRTVMPVVGWLFHGDPETYLLHPGVARALSRRSAASRS